MDEHFTRPATHGVGELPVGDDDQDVAPAGRCPVDLRVAENPVASRANRSVFMKGIFIFTTLPIRTPSSF